MVKNPPTNAEDTGKIPPEKTVATHSSILAWKNLWTEETGGLQSIESQKSQTHLNY